MIVASILPAGKEAVSIIDDDSMALNIAIKILFAWVTR